MRHILVATDFSDVAENAVHFACKMAADLDTSVVILHSFIIPVTFSDTPMPIMPVDEGRDIADERLDAQLAELRREYPQLMIEKKIMFGDVIDCVEEYVNDKNPELIILGNSGLGNSSLWFGSNVVSALKNLNHTVLAVPEGMQYSRPVNICFACDFSHPVDMGALDKILRTTGAQLHVLNVNEEVDQPPAASVENTALHKSISALNPVYHYVEKESVDEGIHDFVVANQMDWLVIMPQKHGFFERLFHKSHTKAMVKMTSIPIVSVHEKKQG